MLEWDKEYSKEEWSKLSDSDKKEIINLRKQNGWKKRPKSNDPAWYVISSQIAKDLGSIPFSLIPGVQGNLPMQYFQRSSTNAGTLSQYIWHNYPVQVMRINYITARGVANTKVEGVNLAATQLYTAVRRRNSGARNYEAADLMMYIMAMDEIYSEFFEIRRAIGTVGLYHVENHSLPDSLLQAMRVDADDARLNIAQYRGRLNILASKINAMAVPAYFSIFKRRDFVASNVFCDASTIRGQMYVFNKFGYYTWSSTGSTKGSSLQYTAIASSDSTTLNVRLARLENMIDQLFLDDDVNTMSGDILKAFTSAKLYNLPDTDENYVIVPVMDENALSQIENSFSVGQYFDNTQLEPGFTIEQQNQVITFAPVGQQVAPSSGPGAWMIPQMKVLNMHVDEVTPERCWEFTRCISTISMKAGSESGSVNFTLTSCGAEIIWGYQIIGFESNPNMYYSMPAKFSPSGVAASTVAIFEYFDWHPFLYMVNSSAPTSGGMLLTAGDLRKYTFVDDETIIHMNQQANTAVVWSEELYSITGGLNG